VDKYDLGWNTALDTHAEKISAESLVRITEKHKTSYRAKSTSGEDLNCFLPGKLVYGKTSDADLPTVGDWCVVGDRFIDESNNTAAGICKVLPRHSKLSRMSAGTDSGEQVLAANIDFVFIVTSINSDFSVNRLQRYIVLAKSGNAQPVIVVSKVDLADIDLLSTALDDLYSRMCEVPCVAVSAVSGRGIDQLKSILTRGQTGVFVGSSGVGKSTLVNELLGRNLQKTTDVRGSDDKGRHTTSGSGLFLLENGGMIIDTAGLREVAIVGETDALQELLPSVAELSVGCKFVNCTHKHEPDCAVLSALQEGQLDEREFESYTRMERELAFARRKLDSRLEYAERKKWKRIAIDSRRRKNTR